MPLQKKILETCFSIQGHIPKQLNPASASKLCCMFSELTNIICQSASVSQKRFLENAKRPYYNPRRGGTDEKNQVLRERVSPSFFLQFRTYFNLEINRIFVYEFCLHFIETMSSIYILKLSLFYIYILYKYIIFMYIIWSYLIFTSSLLLLI